MSNYIKEIIHDIKTNPTDWSKAGNGMYATGIQRGNIVISHVGNTALLSVCDVEIDGLDIPMSYMDRFRIESSVNWWYKNVSLSIINRA